MYSKSLHTLSLLFVFGALTAFSQNIVIQQNNIAQWSYYSSKTYQNPFREVEIDMLVKTPSGKEMKVPGYWAGNNEWTFRYSSPEIGEYEFITICSDSKNKNLHNQKGKIQVTEYTGDNPLFRHGPVKLSANGRYLVHHDETPFFWLADQWWHGMVSRFKWPEDFQTLTSDRKAKGFSVIGFAVGFPCDIAPFDPRGQNEAGDPWADSSFTSINPAYFDLTDLRINWLVKQGLMPSLMGSWGYYIKWAGVENMKAHWRYLIARYGAYPLSWTLAGEVTLAWYGDMGESWEKYRTQFREQWSEVARYIQTTDPYNRVLTVHPGPGVMVDGKPPINDMEALDLVMIQSGHAGYAGLEQATNQIRNALRDYPNKPVLHGEVCFEGMRGSSWADVQRFLFWSNMLMGTAGFSYGVEGIWQFNTQEELFGASPGGNTWGNVPWEIASQYTGSTQVGLGKKFLEKYPWHLFEPHPEWIETPESDIFAPYVAGIQGQIRIMYLYNFPNRWRPTTAIGLTAGKKYEVLYFDPITGQEIPFGTIKADAQGRWTLPVPPVMQEWVIVMQETL